MKNPMWINVTKETDTTWRKQNPPSCYLYHKGETDQVVSNYQIKIFSFHQIDFQFKSKVKFKQRHTTLK